MHRRTTCYVHLSWLSVTMAIGHALHLGGGGEAAVKVSVRETSVRDDGQG